MPKPGDPHTMRAPAALPINEAIRPELVDFGSANLRCENIRQFHAGEASPRFGFLALPSALLDTTLPTTGYKMFADHSTVARMADGLCETLDARSGAWATMPGRPSECDASLIDFPSLGSSSYVTDTVVVNGYACIAWLATTGVGTSAAFAAVTNVATGAVVMGPTQVGALTAGGPPFLATYGSTILLVQANDGTNTVQLHYLDVSSGGAISNGWIAQTDLAADYQAATNIAVCSLTNYAALVYVNTSGGASQLTVVTFTNAGAVLTQTINTGGSTPTFTDINGLATDTLWVAWNEGLNARVCGLNPSNINAAALATTATIITGAVAIPGIFIQYGDVAFPGQGRLWVNENYDITTFHVQSYTCGFHTAGGACIADSAQTTVYAVSAAGRSIRINSRNYIPVIVGEVFNLQQQIILVDWTFDATFLRPVACPAPGLSRRVGQTGHTQISNAGNGVYYFGMALARSAASDATAIASFDFNATTRWQSVPFGNSVFLTGGVAQYSDGRRVAEVGFLVRPTTPITATSGTGITATLGWRYVCVYEEVDNDGNWHVSGLSDPSPSTGVVTNKTVTVTTSPLTVSSRIRSTGSSVGGVRVAYYRTLDGGQAPYYRLGTSVNDTTVGAVPFVDTTTDTTLAANSELYSQPGVLGTAQDRRPPPGLSMLVSYNGMLVGATGSDVWFSGQSVSGEGTWFNPIFQVPVPGEGDIMALAVMDGGLFVFKQREVYSLVGSPPSDNGATGGLGTPVRLACDVGCIESRSVCTTALGIFFQSDRGIELLTRAQSITWIGQKIQKTLAAYPIVTSATVQPTPSGAYVLVEVAASQSAGLVTGQGRTLVFDLSLNEWISTDLRNSVTGVVAAPSQSACMIFTGTAWRYAWMDTSANVHYENTASYLDADGSFTTQLVETGWYNAFQNETRVDIASVRFERYAAAGLTAETAYNDKDYSGEPDSVAAWSEDDTSRQNQLEWSPNPRGETVKIRLTATAPAVANYGTGQGIGFISISLDLAEKQGPTHGSIRLDPALRK